LIKFKYNTLLIIGPSPPPIGGVSIHVKRLIQHLDIDNFNYLYINPKKINFFNFTKNLFIHKVIHLHSSNIYFQLLLSFFSILFNKKILITYHGDLKRYKRLQYLIVKSSIFLCTVPITLNNSSFQISNDINSNSRLISSFIPPLDIYNSKTKQEITIDTKFYLKSFCTNAYNLSFDKYGNEIYQISSIVEVFSKLPNYLLVISDPSSAYKNFFLNKGTSLPNNVFLISYPHNFIEIILQTDCFIRFTTTDGDSISIREALFLGKKVIASNIVDRPNNVTLVNLNLKDLKNCIINICINIEKFEYSNCNTVENLLNLYKTLI
jgi:glycosyltransferase involved in cell wall biosynthesis